MGYEVGVAPTIDIAPGCSHTDVGLHDDPVPGNPTFLGYLAHAYAEAAPMVRNAEDILGGVSFDRCENKTMTVKAEQFRHLTEDAGALADGLTRTSEALYEFQAIVESLQYEAEGLYTRGKALNAQIEEESSIYDHLIIASRNLPPFMLEALTYNPVVREVTSHPEAQALLDKLSAHANRIADLQDQVADLGSQARMLGRRRDAAAADLRDELIEVGKSTDMGWGARQYAKWGRTTLKWAGYVGTTVAVIALLPVECPVLAVGAVIGVGIGAVNVLTGDGPLPAFLIEQIVGGIGFGGRIVAKNPWLTKFLGEHAGAVGEFAEIIAGEAVKSQADGEKVSNHQVPSQAALYSIANQLDHEELEALPGSPSDAPVKSYLNFTTLGHVAGNIYAPEMGYVNGAVASHGSEAAADALMFSITHKPLNKPPKPWVQAHPEGASTSGSVNGSASKPKTNDAPKPSAPPKLPPPAEARPTPGTETPKTHPLKNHPLSVHPLSVHPPRIYPPDFIGPRPSTFCSTSLQDGNPDAILCPRDDKPKGVTANPGAIHFSDWPASDGARDSVDARPKSSNYSSPSPWVVSPRQ